MQKSYLSLRKFILATYILDYFELKSALEKDGKVLDIELEEPNIVPEEESH